MLASARTHAATPTLTAFPGKSVDQHSRRLRRLISCSAVSQPSGMLLLTSKLSLLQITPVPAAPSAATSQSVVQNTLLNNPPDAVKELPFRLFIGATLIVAALIGYYLRDELPGSQKK